MTPSLKHYSSEALLYEILRRYLESGELPSGPSKARYYGDYREVFVGIGKDHTARIGLHIEDWNELDCRINS